MIVDMVDVTCSQSLFIGGRHMLDMIANVEWEMLIRLIIAATLGLLIGLERELKRKSLGLKTILVISIVSCLLTIVSIQSAYLLPGSDLLDIRMDPLRLAAQIISGVGFLGAGVILRRGDDTISGLTTAAIVWGSAGIGVAVGAGFYIEATIGVLLLLISVKLVPDFIFRFQFKKLHFAENHVYLTIKNREQITQVIEAMEKEFHKITKMNIKDEDDHTHVIELFILVHVDEKPTTTYARLQNIPGIDLINLQRV